MKHKIEAYKPFSERHILISKILFSRLKSFVSFIANICYLASPCCNEAVFKYRPAVTGISVTDVCFIGSCDFTKGV